MKQPVSGEVYEHYKRGTRYTIVCLALREADLVPCVVYRANDVEAQTWIRPVDDFCAVVTLEDGMSVPRFRLVEGE